MHPSLLVAVGLALAVVASVSLARATRVPLPVYLVVAGVAASFAPGLGGVSLPPNVVFFGFLPPLLYSSAFLTEPREMRESWRAIAVLAVALVIVTVFAVGGLGVGIGLGAAAAFVLGTVVAPTDPVAATSVIAKVDVPARVRTILEGESLVNDGVALVAFSVALTAAETGTYSISEGLLRFVQVAGGGIAFGTVLGFVIGHVRRRIHDIEIEIPISLLTPFIAYIPAERLHVSGVLATVAAGVYLGWHSGGIFKPATRIQALAFWEVLVYLLTSILFVLLGMQFRSVLAGLGHYSEWTLAWYALVVAAVVSLARLAWMFTVPYLVGLARPSGRGWREAVAPWRDRLVLGWSGMRGAVSLAAALSIPAAVAHRQLILYLTFTTILAGLLVQGVPLPWLLDRLGFGGARRMSRAEAEARMGLASAALARLDELTGEGEVSAEEVGPLRQLYESRLDRLGAFVEEQEDGASRRRAFTGTQRELIRAERRRLAEVARRGELPTATVRKIERELDLDEIRLG